MRKLKEVLRLRYEMGLGQRQIARSCSIGHGTVYEYLKRAQAAGVTWPLPEGWDDRRLEEALFGPAPRRAYEARKPKPDFAQLHQELQQHPHLTLQLAWEGVSSNSVRRLQPVLRTLPAVAAANWLKSRKIVLTIYYNVTYVLPLVSVLQFFGSGFDRGHHRLPFLRDRSDLPFLEQVQLSLEVFQPYIKIAPVPRETAQGLPIAQLDRDQFIAGGDIRTGLLQGGFYFVHGSFIPQVRQVRAY